MARTNIGALVEGQTPCLVCSTTERRILAYQGRHYQKLTTGICTGCGLIHSLPIPTESDLTAYYRSHYRNDYKGTFTPKPKHILRYSRTALTRLEHLKRFTGEGKKLLDVGSGSGEFLYLAKLAGYQAQGLEPHEGYSEYTRKTFQAHVLSLPLEQANIEHESLDMITLHHVLEHLPNPLKSLSILNSWLKMGGIIAVDVPDIERTSHAPNNRFHYAHIFNFNHNTLKAIMTKAGFTVVETEDLNSTTLIGRKTSEPTPNMHLPDGKNYHALWSALSTQDTSTHYTTARPYKRLINKLHRFSSEWIEATLVQDPKRIAAREFEKWQAAQCRKRA